MSTTPTYPPRACRICRRPIDFARQQLLPTTTLCPHCARTYPAVPLDALARTSLILRNAPPHL